MWPRSPDSQVRPPPGAILRGSACRALKGGTVPRRFWENSWAHSSLQGVHGWGSSMAGSSISPRHRTVKDRSRKIFRCPVLIPAPAQMLEVLTRSSCRDTSIGAAAKVGAGKREVVQIHALSAISGANIRLIEPQAGRGRPQQSTPYRDPLELAPEIWPVREYHSTQHACCRCASKTSEMVSQASNSDENRSRWHRATTRTSPCHSSESSAPEFRDFRKRIHICAHGGSRQGHAMSVRTVWASCFTECPCGGAQAQARARNVEKTCGKREEGSGGGRAGAPETLGAGASSGSSPRRPAVAMILATTLLGQVSVPLRQVSPARCAQASSQRLCFATSRFAGGAKDQGPRALAW